VGRFQAIRTTAGRTARLDGCGLHPFTDSLETWYKLGYVDALKSDYRLILLDARGHGNSDKPHDSDAYTWAYLASDVVSVLDAEGLPAVHFLGYSMGGVVGFALAKYAPSRVISLMSGGTYPNKRDRAFAQASIEQLRPGPHTIPPMWGQPLSALMEARLLANDTDALIAMTEGTAQVSTMSLQQYTCRVSYSSGEEDRQCAAVKACSAQMPNATLVSYPGHNHSGTFLNSDLVLREIRRFLQEVVHTSQQQSDTMMVGADLPELAGL
jgi:pimeloyl-ACP methyl ester carboxylesterase